MARRGDTVRGYVAPRTAEDDAFIDDAGVAEEDKWANMSDDEDGKRGYASEAEESDGELEKLFAPGGKGKRRRKDEEMARMEVLDFLSKMEIAVEEDARAYAAGSPVKKLKLLPWVEKKFRHARSFTSASFASRALTVLRAWLDRCRMGTFPPHRAHEPDRADSAVAGVRRRPHERNEERAIRFGKKHPILVHDRGRDAEEPSETETR